VYLSNAADLTIDSIDATGIVNVNAAGTICHAHCGGLRLQPEYRGRFSDPDGNRAMNLRGRLLGVGEQRDRTVCRLRCRDRDVCRAGGDPHGRWVAHRADHCSFRRRCDRRDWHYDGDGYQMPFLSLPALPTLTQCIAAPALRRVFRGASKLAQCTGAPTTAGCDVVLPSLAQCSSAPATAGCSVVLPSVAQCTSAPATAAARRAAHLGAMFIGTRHGRL